jgi:hypothetical protein
MFDADLGQWSWSGARTERRPVRVSPEDQQRSDLRLLYPRIPANRVRTLSANSHGTLLLYRSCDPPKVGKRCLDLLRAQ